MNAFLQRIRVFSRCLREMVRPSPHKLRTSFTLETRSQPRRGVSNATTVAVVILVCCAGWVVRSAALSEPRHVPSLVLVPGEYLEVPVRSDRARFTVPTPKLPTRDRMLVIGSLGNPHNSYRVTVRRVDSAVPPDVAIVRRTSWRKLPACDGTRPQESYGKLEACPTKESLLPSTDNREFYLHVTDGDPSNAAHFAKLRCQIVMQNDRSAAYLDQQIGMTSRHQTRAEQLADFAADELGPRLSEFLGRVSDVDGDRRLSLVFTPWLDRLQGGRTKLFGLVKQGDFRARQETPLSNRADVIFLNASLLEPSVSLDFAKTILVHEFAHAACISQRLPNSARPQGACSEEDWLHEGQAHLAELRFGRSLGNMEHRITEYSRATHQFPLVVEDYYRAGLWRCHGCRGATATFFDWFVGRFGDQSAREVVASSSRGTRNLEQVAGVPFEQLFREWTVWLAKSVGQTGQPQSGRVKSWRDLLNIEPLRLSSDANDMTLEVRGTAAAFVVIEDSASASQIEVVAEQHARMQVSIVP